MAKNKPKNTEHDLKSELHKKPTKPGHETSSKPENTAKKEKKEKTK